MTSLYFGVLREGVPADEKVVRSTATPYDRDAPAAMADSMPDRGEATTDPNPTLGGLVGRQLASMWRQGERFRPSWKGSVDEQFEHNAIVDRQVSSSGTAAAREASGEWGHGTASYAVGIEPVGDLTDGGAFGNEYFKRTDRDIQETADNTMMSVPPGYDHAIQGRVSAEGKVAARQAAMNGLYNTFWNGGE